MMSNQDHSSSQDSVTLNERRGGQHRLFIVALALFGVLAMLIFSQREAWQTALSGSGNTAHAQQESRLGKVRPISEGFQPTTVIPRAFPAIKDVPVKTVAEVEGKLQGSELVLGIVVGEEARAYPINMLTGPQREIINDVVGQTPIAATW